MIEASLISWMFIFIAIFIATVASLFLVRIMPWSSIAKEINLPFAVAIGIAPLLLGLITVVVLQILPGKSHELHLSVIAIILLLFNIANFFQKKSFNNNFLIKPYSGWELIWLILIVLWCIALCANAIFLPLTQNDALEYATVGRILFHTNDLASYPAIHPELTASGFYGPWTHPPLYPVLIYLAYALQGHADFPGLMRIISPWCLLSATFIVYKLGSFHNRLTGFLAALFFISTPLLFLGADSALIDALPVLGMTLVIATITGLDSSKKAAVAQGLILGLALWTHSQAVLFIPLSLASLFFYLGWKNWKLVFRQSIIIVACALIIAAPPYIHNLFTVGKLISDTPAVFALPKLGWNEYFALARGVNTWPERIQYGLFKGWFALEAYSISFWLMLIGLFYFIKALRNISLKDFQHWLIIPTIILLVYLLGVLVSMLLGIDLMIRNERYWLVVIPATALITGFGISKLLENKQNTKPNYFYIQLIITSLLLIVFVSQLIVVSVYRLHENGINLNTKTVKIPILLASRPEISVINYLKNETNPNDLVLSLKPADMFYSSRRMISYLDPRLIPFYQASNPEKGWYLLKKLGVKYIHMPDYYLPSVYNSTLQSILADSRFTTLVYSADGNQIYKLNESLNLADKNKHNQKINFSPNVYPWNKHTELILGGRKHLAAFGEHAPQKINSYYLDTKKPIYLFQRDWSTVLQSGDVKRQLNNNVCIPVVSGNHYVINLNLRGHALVDVYLLQYSSNGLLLKDNLFRSKTAALIGEFALTSIQGSFLYERRFKIMKDTHCIKIQIKYYGTSYFAIDKALIKQY